MKILGSKREKTPDECAHKQAQLIRELENLRPYKKPAGIILKFKTWPDLDKFILERAAKKT